ncbi:PP2C family protein-serine/threonine phosphatase [Haliea sp. E17]|uniref:PP2C family protein-serine/threonine phosphatase n=1 Tax=Haliea sp. E17 TaxID=3401576 RepID=UPI003AAC52D7
MKAGFNEAVGATDIGRRSHNEDSWLVRADLGLVLVADGVGGHLAGEIASAITCESIVREIELGKSLEDAVRCANRDVVAAVAAGRGNHGMASTVVAARLQGADYEVAWVGDSRAYLWDGQLKLLSRDHSLMALMLERGEATREELRDHPQRNVIVQAIGLQAEDDLKVDINRGSLCRGEILMLCSDGLSDVLENDDIARLLGEKGTLQERCLKLVSRSIEQGGSDNSTVVLMSGVAEGPGTLEPTLEWVFDPATGRIEYRNEAAPAVPLRASRNAQNKPGTQPGGQVSPHSTQMLSRAALEQALAEAQGTGSRELVREAVAGGRGPGLWIGGVVAVLALAAVLAWYSGGFG